MRALLRRKVLEPLSRQLTQGVSPSRLALALALGIVLGTIPVLGATTALCAVAGVLLRLNQPAIQVANYVAYPVQLALFVPLFQAGAWLFDAPPVAFTLADARAALARDPWGTAAAWAGANLRAVAAWALLAPVVALVLYAALRPIVARVRAARALP
jgi:uncharacterized protein (DUF2062 family)